MGCNDFNTCSETCGGGTQSCSNSCPNGGMGNNQRFQCHNYEPIRTQACNQEPCPAWKDWSEWSECSASCDGGIIKRTRECTVTDQCIGDKEETEQCNQEKCTPCPNTNCWSYDEAKQTCTLIPGKCANLECEATQMTMMMAPGLFGRTKTQIDDAVKDLNLNATSVTINGTEFSDGFKKVCLLDGDCNLSYEIQNDTLSFIFQLSSSNNPDYLELDADTTVQMSLSTGSDISFQCDYSTKIDVSSSNYTVDDVKISGTEISTGKLDDGFVMDLGSEKITLGMIQKVTITWAIKTLTDLKFYISSCHVVQDETEIDLIKDACLSSVFITEDSFKANSTEVEFSYRTFKIRGKTSNKQRLRCHITICMANYDGLPTSDEQCDADSPYRYTAKQLPQPQSPAQQAASSY